MRAGIFKLTTYDMVVWGEKNITPVSISFRDISFSTLQGWK